MRKRYALCVRDKMRTHYARHAWPERHVHGCRFHVQGKIQGFGSENSSGHYSGGFNNSGSSSGHYGGIGSSGSASGSYRPSGGIGSSIPTSFADAQRAASQFSQVGFCTCFGVKCGSHVGAVPV
jgi:hypothetical protein